MKTFYYTNQLSNRHEARVIEEAVGLHLKGIVKTVNPFYHEDGSPKPEIAQLDAGEAVTISDAEIVAVDMKLIRESDGILAYMKSYSLGSPMELFYAHEILGKPVYVICPNVSMRTHPWLRYCTNKIFNNHKEFIAWAKENL